MSDLIFKNLTSVDRKRKIISSSEIVDNEGVRSIIHRHFVYIIKEMTDTNIQKPEPSLYVLKERNNREQKEKFSCRIKGSVFAISSGRLFLIIFMHSLKINLEAISGNLMEYKGENNT